MRRSLSLAAAALAACACAGAAQAMTFLEATGSGWMSVDDGATRVDMEVTRQFLPGAQSAEGAKVLRGIADGQPVTYSSLSGSSYAAPGVLKARVDGVVAVFPQEANVPIISNGTPVVKGGFSSRFYDTVTLTHPTLAIGSPVEFTFTVNMHLESNRPGHSGPDAAGYDSGSFNFHYFFGSSVDRTYRFPNGLYKAVPAFSFSLPVTVSGLVGDELTFGGDLYVGADDRAGWYSQGGYLWFYGATEQETHLDASNTARFYLDAITPGLQLVSESGHNYAITAVPEPGSWALLAAGLCTVGWRARRDVRRRPS